MSYRQHTTFVSCTWCDGIETTTSTCPYLAYPFAYIILIHLPLPSVLAFHFQAKAERLRGEYSSLCATHKRLLTDDKASELAHRVVPVARSPPPSSVAAALAGAGAFAAAGAMACDVDPSSQQMGVLNQNVRPNLMLSSGSLGGLPKRPSLGDSAPPTTMLLDSNDSILARALAQFNDEACSNHDTLMVESYPTWGSQNPSASPPRWAITAVPSCHIVPPGPPDPTAIAQSLHPLLAESRCKLLDVAKSMERNLNQQSQAFRRYAANLQDVLPAVCKARLMLLLYPAAPSAQVS